MRFLSKALVHSLSWLPQEKNPNTDSTPTRVLSSLVLLDTVAHGTRRLDAFGEDGGGAGDDMMLGSEAMIAGLEQCDIDINAIMNAIMMEELAGQGDNPMPMGSQALGDFLSMLAEPGEQDCSAEQEAQYVEAVKSFITCAGFNIDDGMSEDVLNDINKKCKAFADSATTMLQPDMNALNDCVGAILGDNPLGDLLRQIYHTPDKICSCVPALEDAVPTCLVSVPVPQEQVPEGMKGDIKIPLSIVKKYTCMLDNVLCAALDDFCATELEALDSCLPPADQSSTSCMSVMEKCALESEAPVSMEAPPELTGAELPDACQRLYTTGGLTTNVPERYRHFKRICDDAESKTSTLSSPADASSSEESTPNNTTSSGKPLVMVGVFLGLSLVAAAYLVFRRHRARSGASAFSSGNQFQHVHALNDDLTLEELDSSEAKGIMT